VGLDRFVDDGDPFTDERAVVVFELGPLVPLDRPVASDDGSGLRGAWYTTVADLRAVDRLSALADRAGR